MIIKLMINNRYSDAAINSIIKTTIKKIIYIISLPISLYFQKKVVYPKRPKTGQGGVE